MRLIDADKIQYAKDWVVTDRIPRVSGFNAKAIYRVTKEEIDAMPTVDAVPVVRCGDCRFWSKYPGSSAAPQYHECMARMTHIGNLYTTAGEYCSRGERKDGDHEQDKKS